MLTPRIRAHLGRSDAQLVLRLLGDSGNDRIRAEAALAEGNFDALLDDPRLPAMLCVRGAGACASLPLFCYVMVRHALRRAGEHDRQLADYVATLVLEFAVRGRAERVAAHDDEVYTSLAALLEAAETAERMGDARRSFCTRVHLGNYALWLSGLFPDHVEARRWRRGGPDLDYYEALGRRGFRLAAEHRMAAQHGMAPVLTRAADRFGVLRTALSGMSDALLFPARHTPERLMRQVRDEARWRLAS